MKKLISSALAVAAIVCTTSSLAATSDGNLISESRNDVTVLQADETATSSMPGFRGGDIVSFNVGDLISGNHLTIISYKMGSETDLNNATIQYINQYEIDEETREVEYIVRDNADEGIYKLSLSGNDGSEAINFYYKVGNPEVVMIPGDGTSYKKIQEYQSGGKTKYAVGFVAKAVIGSNDVSFTDVGITELGFTFTANGKSITRKLTQEQFDAIAQAQKYTETDGGIAFVYGITIYGIDDMEKANAIVAEAYRLDN